MQKNVEEKNPVEKIHATPQEKSAHLAFSKQNLPALTPPHLLWLKISYKLQSFINVELKVQPTFAQFCLQLCYAVSRSIVLYVHITTKHIAKVFDQM